MNDRRRITTYIPAAVAAALVTLHFLGAGPEPVASVTKAPIAKKAPNPPRHDLDELKREEWRERHRTSISDVGEDRASKEFRQRMRTLGTTPVEVPMGDDDTGGLFVAKSPVDLAKFLADGGHYSGPLPPDLTVAENARSEDRR